MKEAELDEVMMRMRVFAGQNGSKFDEGAIRAAFKCSLTRKGSSLIRIHSAISANEYDQQTQFSVHTPVQTLQKIPMVDETERAVDDSSRDFPKAAGTRSVPTVLATGLVATTVRETDGTEFHPICLLNDIMKSGTGPTGNGVSQSDDIVLRSLLAHEEFDAVGGNKEETPWIGYILQSFSGGTGVAGPEQKESV